MKIVALAVLAAGLAIAAGNQVDLYSPEELQKITNELTSKRTPFSSRTLEKYGTSHYTMVAHREETGSSEVHEKEDDVFFAISGDAALITGGKLVNETTQKPGELRGTAIEGGTRKAFTKGSIVHIPAGVPHQLIIEKGKPFTYFVVKVVEP